LRGVPTCAANTPRGTPHYVGKKEPPIPDLTEPFIVSVIQDHVVFINGITEKEVGFLQCDTGVRLKSPIGHDL